MSDLFDGVDQPRNNPEPADASSDDGHSTDPFRWVKLATWTAAVVFLAFPAWHGIAPVATATSGDLWYLMTVFWAGIVVGGALLDYTLIAIGYWRAWRDQ